MDIKELKKLINEESVKLKQKKILKEQEEGFTVPSDSFNQSIFNEQALDVMFNLFVHEDYFPSIQGEISDILSEINKQYPLNNFNQLIQMRRALELKLRNIALVTNISSRERKQLSKQEMIEKLKQPAIRQSLEGMLVALKIDSEKTADFISIVLPELIKTQQTQSVNPLAKTIKPGVAKDTPIPQEYEPKGPNDTVA